MQLYFLLIRIAALFGHRKAQLMVKGQKEVWDRLQVTGDRLQVADKPWIWVHVSSVGEFEQARPILERLKAEKAPYKVLLTFFSPSGYEMRKNYDQVDLVTYLPFATKKNAKRFLEMVQPKMAIFVKYEFWPAYLKTLKKQGIATYNIAAIFRPTQLFFKPWGGWYRNLLKCFTTLFVQDEASQQLLDKYKVKDKQGIFFQVVIRRLFQQYGNPQCKKDLDYADVSKDLHLLACYHHSLIGHTHHYCNKRQYAALKHPSRRRIPPGKFHLVTDEPGT